MVWDSTVWAIVVGGTSAGAHSVVRFGRHRDFDASASVTIFLGMASIPICISLVGAALSGDPAELPANWRTYMPVAGLVVSGLSVKKFWDGMASAWTKPAKLAGELQAGQQRVVPIAPAKDDDANALDAPERTRGGTRG